MGRYYAMDRDKRWDRTQKAYDAIAAAKADAAFETAGEALAAAYARGETDEFILPAIVGEPRPVADGDAAIFFNFRPDRARQLTLAFSQPDFKEFPVRAYSDFIFATMTKYEENFRTPCSSGRARKARLSVSSSPARAWRNSASPRPRSTRT